MAVNYKAQLDQLDEQEKAALAENEQFYEGQVAASDAAYEEAKADVADWKTEQENLQNQRTEFELDKIEQQQAQAQQDYEKEQRAAYTDWQKQSAQHGVAAEQMAAAGMTGSGYAESSKVQMYTAYQQRLVAAKESMDKLTINFNNAMTEARLQNNSALAQIAYDAYEQETKIVMAQLAAREDIYTAQQKDAAKIADFYGDARDDITNSSDYKLWLAGQQNQPKQDPIYNNYFNQFQSADPTKSINMDSVFELGFGRITPQDLQQLMDSGQVVAYEDGGEIRFERAEPQQTVPTTSNPDGLTVEDDWSYIRRMGLGPGLDSPATTQQPNKPPATAPTSVEGHGKLTPAKDKNGKTTNLQKAADGTLWYWDSTKKSYSQYQPDFETEMLVDEKSKNALGYNNLTPDTLIDLVENGFVEEIYDGFIVKFKLTAKGRQNKRAMDRIVNA